MYFFEDASKILIIQSSLGPKSLAPPKASRKLQGPEYPTEMGEQSTAESQTVQCADCCSLSAQLSAGYTPHLNKGVGGSILTVWEVLFVVCNLQEKQAFYPLSPWQEITVLASVPTPMT